MTPPNALPPNLVGLLESAVARSDNPVGAMRQLRRAVAKLPVSFRSQEAAVRWAAEKALRPHWHALTGDQAAKAAVWAALDGIWETERQNPPSTNAPPGPSGLVRDQAEKMRRVLA